MEPTTYREPARSRPIARIDAIEDATAQGSLLGAGLVLGHGDLMALMRHLVRASTARRRQGALALFFGSHAVIEAPGMWVAMDGRRRLRAVHGDPLGRFEEIEGGETVWSVRGPSLLLPVPIEPRVIERRTARVHGRAREPRCFTGLPSSLGGRPIAMCDACAVILELSSGGAIIERRDESGNAVGDTWHPDRSAAERQLMSEYGDRLGAWQDVELPIEGDHVGWGGYEASDLVL